MYLLINFNGFYMNAKFMKFINIIFFFLFLIFLSGCNMFSKKQTEGDESVVEKKPRTVNVKERALSDDSGGIFNTNKQKDPLGNQNVMWLATLKALDFMPMQSMNYDGGSIITDWYSAENSNESLKINVLFLSNEVKPSSVKVNSFKKTCQNPGKCKTVKTNKEFNQKIKDQIFQEVKNININQIKN